ncbi:hypothetical protein ACVQ8P_06635 [Dellaglioa sp. BT-FLS60]
MKKRNIINGLSGLFILLAVVFGVIAYLKLSTYIADKNEVTKINSKVTQLDKKQTRNKKSYDKEKINYGKAISLNKKAKTTYNEKSGQEDKTIQQITADAATWNKLRPQLKTVFAKVTDKAGGKGSVKSGQLTYQTAKKVKAAKKAKTDSKQISKYKKMTVAEGNKQLLNSKNEKSAVSHNDILIEAAITGTYYANYADIDANMLAIYKLDIQQKRYVTSMTAKDRKKYNETADTSPFAKDRQTNIK